MTESPNPVATCRDVRPDPVDLLILLGVTGIEVSTAEPFFAQEPAVARDRVIYRVAGYPWDEWEDPCPLPARDSVFGVRPYENGQKQAKEERRKNSSLCSA
jgi:hypothetical protein